MVKSKGNLCSLGRCGVLPQPVNECSKQLQLFIAGIVDDPVESHLLKTPADFQLALARAEEQ